MSKKCLPLGKRLSTLRVSTVRAALVCLPRQVLHNGSGCPPQWAEVSRCTYRVIRLRSWARVLSYPVRGWACLLQVIRHLAGLRTQGVHGIPSRLKACEVSITGAIDSDCAGADSWITRYSPHRCFPIHRSIVWIGKSIASFWNRIFEKYRQVIRDLDSAQKNSLPCTGQQRGTSHS